MRLAARTHCEWLSAARTARGPWGEGVHSYSSFLPAAAAVAVAAAANWSGCGLDYRIICYSSRGLKQGFPSKADPL